MNKKLNFKHFLALSGCALLAFGLLSSTAKAGGDVSGGGDSAELEFVAIGQGLMKALNEKEGAAVVLGIDSIAFKQAVEQTTVSMKRTALNKNEIERTALNYPSERRVEVNRQEWLRLKPADKVGLAFHEYLGIAGVEHDVYAVSSQLQTVLGTDLISKIAAVAAPNPEYRCSLFLSPPPLIIDGNTKDMRKEFNKWKEQEKYCGEVTVKRTNQYEEHAGYFAACDAYLFAPLQASYVENPERFPESLSEFQLLVAQKGGIRASYLYDIYDAPAFFAMRLSYSTGKLMWKKDFTYKLVCSKI